MNINIKENPPTKTQIEQNSYDLKGEASAIENKLKYYTSVFNTLIGIILVMGAFSLWDTNPITLLIPSVAPKIAGFIFFGSIAGAFWVMWIKITPRQEHVSILLKEMKLNEDADIQGMSKIAKTLDDEVVLAYRDKVVAQNRLFIQSEVNAIVEYYKMKEKHAETEALFNKVYDNQLPELKSSINIK